MKKPWFFAEEDLGIARVRPVIHRRVTKGKEKGPWATPGLTDKLKHYNLNTRMSMAEIANALSSEFKITISRSMVIGKLNRLGTRDDRPIKNNQNGRGHRKKETAAGLKQDKRPSGPPIRRSVPIADVEALTFLASALPAGEMQKEGVLILELTASTCRWPLGAFQDHPPYHYCGKQPVDGSPYCAHHARLSGHALQR